MCIRRSSWPSRCARCSDLFALDPRSERCDNRRTVRRCGTLAVPAPRRRDAFSLPTPVCTGCPQSHAWREALWPVLNPCQFPGTRRLTAPRKTENRSCSKMRSESASLRLRRLASSTRITSREWAAAVAAARSFFGPERSSVVPLTA
jgi:hypothetical protein